MEQVLRERGLFVPGSMTTDGNCIRQKQKVYKGDKYNMRLVLSECTDFAAQKSKLEEFCESKEIKVDMSPKCHPEIAGLGIEYDWAVAKNLFRNECDFSHATLSTGGWIGLWMPWHWKWFGCLLVVHATTCAHMSRLRAKTRGLPLPCRSRR